MLPLVLVILLTDTLTLVTCSSLVGSSGRKEKDGYTRKRKMTENKPHIKDKMTFLDVLPEKRRCDLVIVVHAVQVCMSFHPPITLPLVVPGYYCALAFPKTLPAYGVQHIIIPLLISER